MSDLHNGVKMRIAYKPLVNRFDIPRPTLIEWQKKIKLGSKDWRTTHLQYLRDQILLEEETTHELNKKGISFKECYLCLMFFFIKEIKEPLSYSRFSLKLRKFSIIKDFGVEFHHPFSKKIWEEVKVDGKEYKMAFYMGLENFAQSLSSFQLYCFQTKILKILNDIKEKHQLTHKIKLSGSTWQELHTYDKAFNEKAIKEMLKKEGLEIN